MQTASTVCIMNGTVRLRTVTRRDIVTRVANSPICDNHSQELRAHLSILGPCSLYRFCQTVSEEQSCPVPRSYESDCGWSGLWIYIRSRQTGNVRKLERDDLRDDLHRFPRPQELAGFPSRLVRTVDTYQQSAVGIK